MNIQQIDFSIDLLKVIPWQYDGAPNLRGLLQKKQDWYTKNHEEFWKDWERNVFSLRTANDFGLNVWSIILNLPLYTRSDESPPNYKAFGFANFGYNFDNSNFAISGDVLNKLTIEQKRQLLILRWWNLINDGSMYMLNQAVNDVFGRDVYCLNGHNMTITYVFQSKLSDIMMNLLKTQDILPRPAGVAVRILVKPRDAFGFADFGINFDQPTSQFGS